MPPGSRQVRSWVKRPVGKGELDSSAPLREQMIFPIMQKWGPSMTLYSIFQEQPESWILTWNLLISNGSNKLKVLCITLGQLNRSSIDCLCLLARFSLLAMSLLPPLQRERKCKQQHRDVKTLLGHSPLVQCATNKHCVQGCLPEESRRNTCRIKRKCRTVRSIISWTTWLAQELRIHW